MVSARKSKRTRATGSAVVGSVPGAQLDPRLVEELRSRSGLRSITLRLGVEQIEEARRTAETTGVPYQVVLRRWVAMGAAAAQTARRDASSSNRRSRKSG
jgi:hypothetical protein